jgi:hypothetical protein
MQHSLKHAWDLLIAVKEAGELAPSDAVSREILAAGFDKNSLYPVTAADVSAMESKYLPGHRRRNYVNSLGVGRIEPA